MLVPEGGLLTIAIELGRSSAPPYIKHTKPFRRWKVRKLRKQIKKIITFLITILLILSIRILIKKF